MTGKSAEMIQAAVKSQYERFPYPPPIEAISDEMLSGATTMEGCPSAYFHLHWPDQAKRGDLDILVAGCGSSQAVIHAVRLPEARIVAIDLSETSIANSKRLAARHGVTNIEFRQMSLFDVAELGRDFDSVISTGVIHHLPDPAGGLRALRAVLRKGGSMLLMVYAKYGRDSVYLFQDMFRRMGITAENVTEEQVRQLGDLVRGVPETHPFRARAGVFTDFRPEELVDLYLHPQDVAYAVPGVYDLLAQSGLAMQRFVNQGPYWPRFTQLLGHPFYEKVERLSEPEQLAIGELYRAGAFRHTFIACRDDRPQASYRMDFEGEDFWAYVPEPLNGVNVLPRADGQPGVDISVNGHQTLMTTITLGQSQHYLLSRIDGKRSNGEILQDMLRFGDEATARSFVTSALRDLWMFDAVAFQIPTAI